MPGMTIAELVARKLRNRFGRPRELAEHGDKNPLDLRIGATLAIDTLEERDLFFAVREIRHAVERFGERDLSFTDYELVATPGGDDDRADEDGRVRRTLRVWAAEEGDRYLRYILVVLAQFHECDYQQAVADNLHNVDFVADGSPYPALQDPEGEFHDFETGEKYVRRFRSIAGWQAPHVVRYTILRDADGNGRVDADEVEEGRDGQFWDYELDDPSRKVYLFVEQDADGYFRLKRGRQVPQELVTRL